MESSLEEEIRRLLKSVVREVAQELMSEHDFSSGTQVQEIESDLRYLLRSHEAAERLGISQGHLSRLTRSGVLPCVRVGRLVHYSTETIRQWIREAESTEPPTRIPKQKSPLQKAVTLPTSKPTTKQPKSPKTAKKSVAKKTTNKKPMAETQAKKKNRSSVRRKTKPAVPKPERISPFSQLLAEMGVDRDLFPGITFGEIRKIAEVDIPTLQGWSDLNRTLPEEALQRLRDHFGKFANKSHSGG